MVKLIEWVKFFWVNTQVLIAALLLVFGAMLKFLLIIPGNQGEALVQKAIDFLSKFVKQEQK